MTHRLTYYGRNKAYDKALWLNFERRRKLERFGAIQGLGGRYLVVPLDHPSFEGEKFDRLPDSYAKMSYSHVQEIVMDDEPLSMWEIIKGMVSTVDGETLRFILKYHIPIDKFIRFELAVRGYDADNRWCGFEKARKIWLK